MSEAITCSNCRAPVEVDPKKPVLVCPYCGANSRNTLYQPPKPKPAPAPTYGQPRLPGRPGGPIRRKYLWLFYLAPVVVGLLGAIPAMMVRSPTAAHRVIAPTMPAPQPASSLTGQEQAISAMIDCLDSTYDRIKLSRARYSAWRKRNPKAPPTCKERLISYGLHVVDNESCLRARETLGQLGDVGLKQLDAASAAYEAVVAELAKLTREADGYYDKKGYLLDDCARAQELHPKLVSGFNKALTAGDALRAALGKHAKGALARCLAQNKDRPERKGSWLWARMLQAAGDAVEVMRQQWKAPKPELAAIKEALKRFNQAAAAVDNMGEELSDASGYRWARRGTEDFVEAAMGFIKSKAGRRFTGSARAHLRWGTRKQDIAGTFERVAYRYGEMLEKMRHMRHCPRLPICLPEQCPEPR